MEPNHQSGQLLEDSKILIRKILDEFKEEDDYLLMIDNVDFKYWSLRMTLELSVKLKPIQSILIEDVRFFAQAMNSIQNLNFFILVQQNKTVCQQQLRPTNPNSVASISAGKATSPQNGQTGWTKSKRDSKEEETFTVLIIGSYFLRIRDLDTEKLKMLKDFMTFLLNVGYKVFEAIKYHSDNMFIGRARNLFQNFIDIASSTIELQQKIDLRSMNTVLQFSDKSGDFESNDKVHKP